MNTRSTSFLSAACCAVAAIALLVVPVGAQDQIQKAKIFDEEYPLILETDLYCSIFLLEGELPELRIVGSERQREKDLLSDADVFYLDRGSAAGLEVGQLFLVVGVGEKLGDYGRLAQRKGKARIVAVEDERATVRVDKACQAMTLGDVLYPFEERDGLMGKDLGFDTTLVPGEGLSGHIIHLQTDFNVLGSGHWAIIDLGGEQGIQPGRQLTVFKRAQKNLPREAVGNMVVIDVQKRTATVKLLSVRDAVETGDEVQAK
jgi:hypothetical protein